MVWKSPTIQQMGQPKLMVELAAKSLLAYLLGSVSGSLLLGKLRGVDIRQSGSGNAGGTNALRSQGWWFALGVVLIDVGKGWLAAGWVPGLDLGIDQTSAGLMLTAGACGLAAILGHNYPVFFGFRGGKGAATYIGTWLALLPMVLLPVLLGFIIMLVLSGYVGLSTITAALVSVPATWILTGGQASLAVYAAAAAALIVFAHRSNIQRLLAGTESRFDKVRASYWLNRSK